MLLLDTCAALWWWCDAPQLPPTTRELMADANTRIGFSAVSAMEIATKVRLGKLSLDPTLRANLAEAVRLSDWETVSLSVEAAQLGGLLGWAHRDPFDRLLAAQALHHGFALVTCDPAFAELDGLQVVW